MTPLTRSAQYVSEGTAHLSRRLRKHLLVERMMAAGEQLLLQSTWVYLQEVPAEL